MSQTSEKPVDAPHHPAEIGKVGYKNPPVETRFKAGNRANPGGKPVKARNRLQGDFVRRLADDFERFGIYAIARVRRHDPATYVRVCASLMPKELEIIKPLDDISDEQLDAALIAVRAIFAAQDTGSGEATAGVVQSAEGVSTISETS